MTPATKRLSGLILVVALAATIVAATAVSGAGGHTAKSGATKSKQKAAADNGAIETIQSTGRDFSHKSCDEPFQSYDLGPTFQAYSLEYTNATCTSPEPVASQRAGGMTDPDSLQRNHYRTSIYGTCKATSDTGCPPPVEIQVWPACERSAADYNMGEPENVSTVKPTEVVNLRGVPGRFYGPGRLELSTGDVTVVVYGNSKELVLAAAEQLQSRSGAAKQIAGGQELPAPVARAQEGTLPC